LNAPTNDTNTTDMDPRTNRILNAPALPVLLGLAAPNAMAFIVQACVNMTEVWYVGQLGTVSLAAMALTFPLVLVTKTPPSDSSGTP